MNKLKKHYDGFEQKIKIKIQKTLGYRFLSFKWRTFCLFHVQLGKNLPQKA